MPVKNMKRNVSLILYAFFVTSLFLTTKGFTKTLKN